MWKSKFSTLTFSLCVFPMKATINLSKFYSSKFRECSICQILLHFSTVKVLRYTIYSRKPSYITKVLHNSNLCTII